MALAGDPLRPDGTEKTITPDLSVVIVASDEGRLLRPSIRSVLAAVEGCADGGLSCEILIAVVGNDEATICEAATWESSGDAVLIRLSAASRGEGLNAAVGAAKGDFVATLGAGDMMSSGFLAHAYAKLRISDDRTCAHPEAVLTFGRANDIRMLPDMQRIALPIAELLHHNPWSSLLVAPRSLIGNVPFRAMPSVFGRGAENWAWNADVIAAGALHTTVPDSMHLVRSSFSPNPSWQPARLLVGMDVEAVRSALRADGASGSGGEALPPRLDEEATDAVATDPHGASRDAVLRVRRRVAALGRRVVKPRTPAAARQAHEVDSWPSEKLRRELHSAANVDPAISWAVENLDTLVHWQAQDDGHGALVDEMLIALGTRRPVVVAVPWLGIGGADLAAANYLRAMRNLLFGEPAPVLLTTGEHSKTDRKLVPSGVDLIQIPVDIDARDPDWRQRFFAQLVVLASPQVLIGINCYHLTNAMHQFSGHMAAETAIYLALFGFDRRKGDLPSSLLTDEGMRAALDDVTGILTDNPATAEQLDDILGLGPIIHVQRQPAFASTPPLDETGVVFAYELSETAPIRIVWPHRLDAEKRPDVLARIARALEERGIRAEIDVWGSAVLGPAEQELLQSLSDAGVIYRGPYSGGLMSLPLRDYHALLLTSETEGLPLVLVQALLLGVPVIATDVGGVSELIIEGETGLLVSHPDDIPGFVEAIIRMRDPALRRRLVANGQRFASENHGWDAFQASVNDVFGLS